MQTLTRWLTLASLACVLLFTISSPSLRADEDDDANDPVVEVEDDFKNDFFDKKECICAEGTGACPRYLRSPKKPPNDPSWCHRSREYSAHDGGVVPFGWNPLCFNSSKEENYLKRHSAAWSINCSECVQNEHTCKFKAENCPNCGANEDSGPLATDYKGADAKATVLDRLAKESRHFKKSKSLRVLYNKQFYLVTDMSSIKVATSGGSKRIASGHEWAHIMMERAMYARREFEWHFNEGGALQIGAPTGMFIPRKERPKQSIAASYLGSPNSNVLLGGGQRGSSGVADGFCWHGFTFSQQSTGDDHDMHMTMRHMIGHELISCWIKTDPYNRSLPRWVNVGAAHWLARLQDRFRDDATFCGGEGGTVSGSGKGWDADCRKMAGSSKLDPIEKLFGKTSSNQLSLDDHKRSWSYFDICMREWRVPFVKMLADLRRNKEVRDAFMDHMDLTPEIFNERWIERVTGRRRHMSPKFDEDEPEENDSPGARERRSLKREADLFTLAAKVRALGTVSEPKTMELIIDLLAKKSELVREQIVVTMLKTVDEETVETMWQYGLAHKHAMARAYTARVCGKLKLEFAQIELRKQLGDRNWYARAEAAIALGLMSDIDAMAGMRKMLNDKAEKARVAAMDALAMFKEDGFNAVPLIIPHLKAGPWQLRVVAAQSLGELGSMDAVGPLIERMEIESGRLRREIREALKKITYDDLGQNPKHWRDWWTKLKNNTPNGKPGRPTPTTGKTPDKKKDPDSRYAKQEYYGIELFSDRIGFVLDTSGSMTTLFEPDPSAMNALKRKYTQNTNKIHICKEEIAYALKSLDPRAHINIISFGTRIRSWKKNPVPASNGNVNSAISFLRSLPAQGETNYYGALRAALDLGDKAPAASPNFRSTPDTMTFLTDGMPTRGEISNSDVLLEWYTALNRYARVKTHVIAFGTKGVDINLLRRMAEQNGGNFVHVREKQ